MINDRLTGLGLLLLRLGAGGLMLFAHGIGKISNWSKASATFPDPLGILGSEGSLALAIFAEVVCSALVMVGLFTRFAALPVVGVMFFAAFVIHASDPFTKKELALVYLVAFAALALLGGGQYSVGEWLRRRRKSK